MKVWTVSEITGHIKVLFNADPTLARVAIRGEISNFSVSGAGGHAYFVLKDGRSQLNAVMWSSKLAISPVRPTNGSRVVAMGRITVYDAAGRYQIMIEELRADGAGDLYGQFLRLKEKLAAEGLFDADRKKSLPTLPGLVGIVTSPTGAAIQDMLRILRSRCPSVRVVLSPAIVQGDEAPYSIIPALHRLVKFKPDVIIIGRGGGSFEELNAFNHEGLARAVSSCVIPIVSAVGHETDFTILDLVADQRAPTPTAAAAMVVPETAELRAKLAVQEQRLAVALKRKLERDKLRLRAASQSAVLRFPDRLLDSRRQRLDDFTARLNRALERLLVNRRRQLDRLSATLAAVDPESVLGRGYAIVRRTGDQHIVRYTSELPPGDRCQIQVADGIIDAQASTPDPDHFKEDPQWISTSAR